MIPIYILTNNNHLWLLRGFNYLWQKYCGKPYTIAGFDPPDNLPPNANFLSLSQQLPSHQWSDGLLKMIGTIQHKYFILMLEDYWLYDHVDYQYVQQLGNMIDDNVLRIDLAGNRASYKAARRIEAGIVETPSGTPYQMSYQAGIWHKENLRKVLTSGEDPWESEINGSERLGNLRVLGTKPAVMRYQPVYRSRQQRWQLSKIKTEDLEYMFRHGYLDAPR